MGFEITRGQLYSEDPDFVRRVIDYPAPVVTSLAPAATTAPSAANSAVEWMKKCARDLKKERQRWYFDETGMTTTIDSGAAQTYANLLEAQGIEPKRPLPFRLCE